MYLKTSYVIFINGSLPANVEFCNRHKCKTEYIYIYVCVVIVIEAEDK